MALERTLTIIKPDAVERNLVGEILSVIEKDGFKILSLKMVYMSMEQARAFYKVHVERPFYDSLTKYMSSGPAVVAALERENAIERLREMMGNTDPAKAEEGTIRKMFAQNIERNSIHGSDAPETAAVEIPFFFSFLEIFE
jgi:nucleoside-diphosphate kinase